VIDSPRVSIIIPALNESARIVRTLSMLQELRRAGHEVILVDGGSRDGTVEIAARWVDRITHGPTGRALQMNAGAREARGEILLFLHADTLVPPAAAAAFLARFPSSSRVWGRFDVRLSGRPFLLRIVESLMSLRSRLTGIATGDQAIFVRRDAFEQVGAYPEIPLMEDIALSRALKRLSRPLCIREPVVTCSRRWEVNGIVRTILLMWRLRLAYAFGADPRRLARLYAAGRPASATGGGGPRRESGRGREREEGPSAGEREPLPGRGPTAGARPPASL
jgi:rSAM/selenodomain-associated transferase 2